MSLEVRLVGLWAWPGFAGLALTIRAGIAGIGDDICECGLSGFGKRLPLVQLDVIFCRRRKHGKSRIVKSCGTNGSAQVWLKRD